MIKKIFFTILILAACLYAGFLFVLPPVMSSHFFLDAVDDILAEKTDIILKSENFNVKTYPSLLTDIAAGSFNLMSNENELLNVKNALVTFDLKGFKIKKADIDYIYLSRKNFKNTAKTLKKNKTFDFKPHKLPELNVKRAEIQAADTKEYNITANFDDIKIKNIENITKLTFQAEIISNLLQNPLYIGRNGYIYAENNIFYAENLELSSGSSKLTAHGKIFDEHKKFDFKINADDIPASDIAAGLLYFQKSRDNSKKFIENFHDFSGKTDADLRITNEGIFGECNIENLAGKTVLFNVPILFKRAPFTFSGREFSAAAFGTLGTEKVYTDVKLTGMGTKELETRGSVQSVLTERQISKYVPGAKLTGRADARVDYHIKNKKPAVKYRLDIPKGADIYYSFANLGMTEKNRQLNAETLKDGGKLELVSYDYSAADENNIMHKIITGNGMFTKINGRMKPDYITAKTQGDAPVSTAGYFYKYLEGGYFNGDLKYDFNKNKVTGSFKIKNSKYRHYRINEAIINADNNFVKITSEGTYRHSPYKADITGRNNFNGRIKIYKLYLFLDELKIKTGNPNKQHYPKHDIKIDEKRIKTHAGSFDIDLYNIVLNKLIYRRAVLSDINLTGSIKDNIFNFDVPDIKFANGRLSAKGFYDFEKRASAAEFSADDINADTAADMLFNLPGQIEGTADGVLKIKTTNGIENREGHLCFDIKQGFLPQLGTTEFIIKKAKLFNKSFTLDDIVNIDMKNMKEFASDIEGQFNIYNRNIENIDITSYNKYLSLYAEGSYNIQTDDTDLRIFGSYNKNEIAKVKVLHIPLSLILKIVLRPEKSFGKYKNEIDKIPALPAEKKDIKNFRIKIKGSHEKNDVKMELKSII